MLGSLLYPKCKDHCYPKYTPDFAFNVIKVFFSQNNSLLKSPCLILEGEWKYSVQILSFYLRIWMEVDKYVKTFIWKTFLEIPCVFLVTAKQFTN